MASLRISTTMQHDGEGTMKEALQGPLINRYPTVNGLPELVRRNADGTNFIVRGHTHPIDHVTFLWMRWKLTIEKPLMRNGAQAVDVQTGELIFILAETRLIAGNGPDSFVLVKAEDRHTLELLDEFGFYLCSFGHVDEDGNPSPNYRGMLHTTG